MHGVLFGKSHSKFILQKFNLVRVLHMYLCLLVLCVLLRNDFILEHIKLTSTCNCQLKCGSFSVSIYFKINFDLTHIDFFAAHLRIIR